MNYDYYCMNKISLVLLCKNSSEYLVENYRYFRKFNEVLVIDDNSDGVLTENVCKNHNYKYYKRALNKDFAGQRNFALEKCNNDWVFYLDTDEYINDTFTKELLNYPDLNKYDGYYIKRDVYFMDHKMSGTEMGNDKVMRLAKKNSGLWIRKVHEYWDVKGNIGIIKTPVKHLTSKDLNSFIQKINIYHPIHASANTQSGKTSGIYKIIFYPFFKFINNFILLKGYKDGVYGFVASLLMSLHAFLSWSHLYLTRNNKA